MNRFDQLRSKVAAWAEDKGILSNATPLAQIGKTLEEVNETQMAIMAQNMGMETFVNHKGKVVNTRDEIEDGIGDILVTVIIQCEMQGIDPTDALQSAYDVISKRTGQMKNGVFVKNE